MSRTDTWMISVCDELQLWEGRMQVMDMSLRFTATAVRLVAHLDQRRVDMHFVTKDDLSVVLSCQENSIFRICDSIEQLRKDCPEILTWKNVIRERLAQTPAPQHRSVTGGRDGTARRQAWPGAIPLAIATMFACLLAAGVVIAVA